MYQSLTGNQVIPEELLWKNTPPDKINDIDFLLEIIDWDFNLDPSLKANRFMAQIPARPTREMEAGGYSEQWICYKSPAFSAKELAVLPGRTVTIRDGTAYGLNLVHGNGTMGAWTIETPSLIRFGLLTNDEFFVCEQAAREGVTITNRSATEPIVMLKTSGPGIRNCRNMMNGKKFAGSSYFTLTTYRIPFSSICRGPQAFPRTLLLEASAHRCRSNGIQRGISD